MSSARMARLDGTVRGAAGAAGRGKERVPPTFTGAERFFGATFWRVARVGRVFAGERRADEDFFDFDQIKDGDGFLCVKSTGSTPGQDKQYCGRYGYDPCFSYNVTNINDNTAKGQLTA